MLTPLPLTPLVMQHTNWPRSRGAQIPPAHLRQLPMQEPIFAISRGMFHHCGYLLPARSTDACSRAMDFRSDFQWQT